MDYDEFIGGFPAKPKTLEQILKGLGADESVRFSMDDGCLQINAEIASSSDIRALSRWRELSLLEVDRNPNAVATEVDDMLSGLRMTRE